MSTILAVYKYVLAFIPFLKRRFHRTYGEPCAKSRLTRISRTPEQCWPKHVWVFFIISLSVASCGYRWEGPSSRDTVLSLSIPYVQGDIDGRFTEALIQAFASSGAFRYTNRGSDLVLHVSIVRQDDAILGWKYNTTSRGATNDDLVATEGRKSISLEVRLADTSSGDLVCGPTLITADVDYDYYEPDSILDLSFIDAGGARQTSMAYSLGQLDSTEGAQDATLAPLAKKCATLILNHILRTR